MSKFDSQNPWHSNADFMFGFQCEFCRNEVSIFDAKSEEFAQQCVEIADKAQLDGWKMISEFEFLCPSCVAANRIHMKIVLVRHGPPEFKAHWLMPTKGAKDALDSYASSRVTTDIPVGMPDFRSSMDICVTSKLARAIDSAKVLGIKDSIASDIFNESELPHPNRLLIPLPWGIFLVIYRLLWLCGFSLNCAGRSMDRQRACEGSNYLSKLATENRMVLLVGHGIMNRLLCSELISSGWKIDKKTGSSYWSTITLSREPFGSEVVG